MLWGLLIAGIFWARGKSHDVKCKGIEVEVVNDDNLPFVTPAAIKEELERNHISVVNHPVWQVDIDKIEGILAKSPYIEFAQCYLTAEGSLRVKVSQLVPVVRVFDGDNSYYLNKDGKKMRATASYHADVPIIRGHFDNRYPATRLLPLVQYVNNDSALNALVTMYNVQDSNNIFLIPSIYGHVINFGNIDNIESKFEKLQLFYRRVMPERGWMTFDTISVKWNHQVVATRRVKKVETVVQITEEDNEDEADLATAGMGEVQAPEKKKEEPKKEEPKKDVKKKEEPKKKDDPKKSVDKNKNNNKKK